MSEGAVVISVLEFDLLHVVFGRSIGTQGRRSLHFDKAQGVAEGEIDAVVDISRIVGIIVIGIAVGNGVICPPAVLHPRRIQQVILAALSRNGEIGEGESVGPGMVHGHARAGGRIGLEGQIAGHRPVVNIVGCPGVIIVII